MKILVIFTGGTIGSSENEQWISLDGSTKYTLIRNYRKENGNAIKFDVLSPYTILSENLSAKELTTLCALVSQKVKEGYDGIIVTHGTDTVQYTASALAYTVDCNDIPVVLVSANLPLENEKTNGNVNFKSAVDFIASKKAGGVFVAYCNQLGEGTDVHYATRILSHAESMDQLFSLDGQPFATVRDGEVVLNDKCILAVNIEREKSVQFVESPKVLVVTTYPGDEFNYNLEDYNAVLIKPYHSGTLNTENQKLSVFCEKAKNLGVPVFLPNVSNGTAYESSKLYEKLSLTVLPYSTVPAIYTKIWLAVSLKKQVKDFVLKQISAEFIH